MGWRRTVGTECGRSHASVPANDAARHLPLRNGCWLTRGVMRTTQRGMLMSPGPSSRRAFGECDMARTGNPTGVATRPQGTRAGATRSRTQTRRTPDRKTHTFASLAAAEGGSARTRYTGADTGGPRAAHRRSDDHAPAQAGPAPARQRRDSSPASGTGPANASVCTSSRSPPSYRAHRASKGSKRVMPVPCPVHAALELPADRSRRRGGQLRHRAGGVERSAGRRRPDSPG